MTVYFGTTSTIQRHSPVLTDPRVHTERFNIPMRKDVTVIRHLLTMMISLTAHAANQNVDVYVFTTGFMSASAINVIITAN